MRVFAFCGQNIVDWGIEGSYVGFTLVHVPVHAHYSMETIGQTLRVTACDILSRFWGLNTLCAARHLSGARITLVRA